MKGIGDAGGGGLPRRPSLPPSRGAATSSRDPARLRRPPRPPPGQSETRPLRLAAPRAVLDSGPWGGPARTPALGRRGAARSPQTVVGLPTWQSRHSLCWHGSLGCGHAGFPGWPLQSAVLLERATHGLRGEKAAPGSGVCLLQLAVRLPLGCIHRCGIKPSGGIVNYSCLPKSSQGKPPPRL